MRLKSVTEKLFMIIKNYQSKLSKLREQGICLAGSKLIKWLNEWSVVLTDIESVIIVNYSVQAKVNNI